MDGTEWAAIITAGCVGAGSLLTSLAGIWINVTNNRRAVADRAEIKESIDGLSDKRAAASHAAGTAEGHAAGVADERADPQTAAR